MNARIEAAGYGLVAARGRRQCEEGVARTILESREAVAVRPARARRRVGPGAPLQSPTLRSVVASGACAGCGACAALAPSVRMDYAEPGYLRPVEVAPPDPAEEEAIAAVCPGKTVRLEAEARHDTPLWGPILRVRTGHAADPDLRYRGASGGALSAMLVHLLSTGIVDAIVQTAAAADWPIGNATVVSRTAEDVRQAASSRYAPSAPLADIPPLLAGAGRFAFVGKPCDVAALRAMARRDPRVNERFPVMISFFCAGVPSMRGVRTLLSRLGVGEADVRQFRFRGEGWPGRARADLADGTSRSMSYVDSWGRILTRTVQPRCRICPDGTGSFADVVFADAWEADADGYPTFQDGEGRSFIVSRTARGEALVAAALFEGAIVARPGRVEDIAPAQPGQVRKRQVVLARLAALRLCLRPIPRFEGFHLADNSRQFGLLASLREILATVRRIAAGRL
ncbi:MAG: hypothetical protein AcusKO_00480 [Acuticoccus sp.]